MRDAERHFRMGAQFLHADPAARRARPDRAAPRRIARKRASVTSSAALSRCDRLHQRAKILAIARAASSAASKSRTRSCHGTGLSCQRYRACTASLRASARAPVAATGGGHVGRHLFQRQQHHLQRRPRASPPLFQPSRRARSSACSTVSVVSTPKATGMPVSRAARAMPRAPSPATKSKCAVSPRITQPSATMASKRPVARACARPAAARMHPACARLDQRCRSPPWRTQRVDRAASIGSTMKSLNRAATQATRTSRADARARCRRSHGHGWLPSGRNRSLQGGRAHRCRDVLRDFQVEGGDALQLLGRATARACAARRGP